MESVLDMRRCVALHSWRLYHESKTIKKECLSSSIFRLSTFSPSMQQNQKILNKFRFTVKYPIISTLRRP